MAESVKKQMVVQSVNMLSASQSEEISSIEDLVIMIGLEDESGLNANLRISYNQNYPDMMTNNLSKLSALGFDIEEPESFIGTSILVELTEKNGKIYANLPRKTNVSKGLLSNLKSQIQTKTGNQPIANLLPKVDKKQKEDDLPF